MNTAYLKSGLLILANLGILAWWLTRQPTTESPSEEPLITGEHLPSMGVLSAQGGKVDLKAMTQGRWTMILYCRYKLPWQNVHYLQTLQDRFAREKFQALVVVNAEHGLHFTEAQEKVLNIPILYETEDRVAEGLGLYRDGLFFTDPQGTIAFSAAYMVKRADLRKVAEKFLLGEISYGSGDRVQPQKENLADLVVYDAQTGQFGDLVIPGNAHFIILTAAMCSVCNTDAYFGQVAATVRALRHNETTKGDYVAMLLTAGFDLAKAQQSLQEHGLDLDIYQATREIEGFEDEYYTDRSGGQEKVIVASFDQSLTMSHQSMTSLYESLVRPAEVVHHAE